MRVRVLAAASAALLLAGCGGGSSGEAAAPSAAPSGSPSASAEPEPELLPDGTVEENKPYFDAVNRRVIDEVDSPRGRDFIDALWDVGLARFRREAEALARSRARSTSKENR